MKTVIIILLVSFFAIGCSRTPSYLPSAPVYGFVKHWKQDTLLPNGHASATPIDTMYSFLSGDTSYVIYKGTKLYVFYDKSAPADHDSNIVHVNCYIGPAPLDTAAAWSKCDIFPSGFYDATFSTWKTQKQGIVIHSMHTHFDTTSGNRYFHF